MYPLGAHRARMLWMSGPFNGGIMREVKAVRESDYLLGWFVFWLSSTVASMVIGAIGGGIVGGVLGAMAPENTNLPMAGGALAGFVLGLPVSYGCFRLCVASFIVKRATVRIGESASSADARLDSSL